MINLTQPRYVMPVHGDHRRLAPARASWPRPWACEPEAIFRGENGLPLEIDERGARFGEPEQAGMIFVDGVDVGDIEDVALRDRRMLSADGIFIVVATISEQDGRSVAPPEIIFRGVPFARRRGRPASRRSARPSTSRSRARPRRRSARSSCSRTTSTTTSRSSSTSG